MIFIEDTRLHRLSCRIGSWLPQRLQEAFEHFTLGLVTQLAHRAIAKRMVQSDGIRVIHQPTPVSPRAPSLMFGVGVPVIIGPMNGGMEFPPSFRRRFEGTLTHLVLKLSPIIADIANLLIPGKHCAAMLLVANSRARRTLPVGCRRRAVTLVENGVISVESDASADVRARQPSSPARFVFVGSLIGLKGVDLLLDAFAKLPSAWKRRWISSETDRNCLP